MPRTARVSRTFALGLALLLATAGCSTLPTQPLPSSSVSTASGSGEGSAETLSLLGGSSMTGTRTKTIGVLGGTVSAGDFTVVFLPGTLTQNATVTVSQPDLAHPIVNLSISPPSANRFLLPVVLTANASRLDRTLLSTACISYYNPTTGQWENLASTVSVASLTLSTPLWHFSTYRVTSGGKAGW